jgi:hypothetical protein
MSVQYSKNSNIKTKLVYMKLMYTRTLARVYEISDLYILKYIYIYI